MTNKDMLKKAKKISSEKEIWKLIKGNSLGGHLEEVGAIVDDDGQKYCLYADDLDIKVYAVSLGIDPEWLRLQEEYEQMMEEALKASAEEDALNNPDFDYAEPEYGTV